MYVPAVSGFWIGTPSGSLGARDPSAVFGPGLPSASAAMEIYHRWPRLPLIHCVLWRYTQFSEGYCMRKYGKFAALIAVVIGTLVWLAFAGSGDSKTYYKSIDELSRMGDRAYGARLRVGGDVALGSIQHVGGKVLFTLKQDTRTLEVAYAGIDPLP